MKMRYLIAGLAGMVLCTFGVNASIAADKVDENFIKKAADANMTEIQLGKIAGDNGQSQAVKDFGERMVKDHTAAGDNLKPIAEKLKVELPNEVSAKHKETIDKLSKEKGNEFDKNYAKGMVQDHEKVVAMFEKAEGEVKDADLKKFVQDTLPTLKEHLELAKKLPSGK